jgi:NAD(P)-dependent dehydrogenase (short-subunit alcohol dehydrogenase family)
MDLELGGRVFLVTGATDGLGAALAEGLVAEGAHVVGCGRDPEHIRSTAEHLGDTAAIVAADVTVPDDLARLVDTALDRFGRVDGVVNNAGRSSAGRFDTLDDDTWTDDLELKVLAAVRLVRLCLPHLRAAPGAAVVNVLNIGARAPSAASLPTSASRAAGLAITKALSKELGPDGIRVNAVMIGVIESGQWRRRAEASGRDPQELHREMGAGIPLGRIGRASEFADLVSYLLSPRASYVTGCAINLDGGTSPVS